MGSEAGRPKYLRDSNTCQWERAREPVPSIAIEIAGERECECEWEKERVCGSGEREYLADTLSTNCRVCKCLLSRFQSSLACMCMCIHTLISK